MGITGLSILSMVYLIHAIQMMRRKKSPTKCFAAAGLVFLLLMYCFYQVERH